MSGFSEFFAFIPVAFTALFPVLNPIGTAVLFYGLTPEADNKLRKNIAWKIALNSLVLMVTTQLLGIYVLNIFGISIPVVQLCGGLVLFVMGWKSLHSDEEMSDSNRKRSIESDLDADTRYKNQAFYPFTFPFTVGPGTIATTLTLSAEASKGKMSQDIPTYAACIVAMVLLALAIFLFYGYSDRVVNRLNVNMRRVIMRLLSFILLCIGGQITINGIRALIDTVGL